jgi:hypothetical protein
VRLARAAVELACMLSLAGIVFVVALCAMLASPLLAWKWQRDDRIHRANLRAQMRGGHYDHHEHAA